MVEGNHLVLEYADVDIYSEGVPSCQATHLNTVFFTIKAHRFSLVTEMVGLLQSRCDGRGDFT